jgi:hypothetical protein
VVSSEEGMVRPSALAVLRLTTIFQKRHISSIVAFEKL